jgi:hypothetical protein
MRAPVNPILLVSETKTNYSLLTLKTHCNVHEDKEFKMVWQNKSVATLGNADFTFSRASLYYHS